MAVAVSQKALENNRKIAGKATREMGEVIYAGLADFCDSDDRPKDAEYFRKMLKVLEKRDEDERRDLKKRRERIKAHSG